MFRYLVTLMITSMIFFPEKVFYEKPEDYGFDWEEVSVQTEDGVKLFGWYLKAEPSRTGANAPVQPSFGSGRSEARGTLLFLHGNAGNISGRLSKAKGWVERGYSVLLMDYRGYGQSEGEIQHEEDIVKDGAAALDWLLKKKNIPLSRIIFYGESLGSYPAIRLAVQHKAAALILEAPFTSFVDLAKLHYAMLPGFLASTLLKDFAFRNLDYIEKIQTPLFVLHGTGDEICPYEMGEQLFEKAPELKGFLSIPGGSHNALPIQAGEDYWQKPAAFVETCLG